MSGEETVVTHETDDTTWYELMRACPAIPLATDGAELSPEDLSPGLELAIDEERDERLVVVSRGSVPDRQWRYLVTRTDFERAITRPEDLPREGQAPTASSNTAGSPE